MQRLYLPLFLMLAVSNAYAAPTLQMHVFEEGSVAAPEVKAQTKTELSPTRKHNLQTHVFEHDANLLAQHHATAAAPVDDNKPILQYQRAEFYAATGYRQDDLDWSISGISGTPNILSELEWQDIKIATLNVGSTLYFQPNWLLNFDFTYGHIFSGENQDSDYRANNRSLEFSRSNNSADEGITLDASIHAAYRWLASGSTRKQVYLIPKIGFSYHNQFFKMTTGEQTLSTVAPEFGITTPFPLGRFSGLDSNYDATWYGPWLGLESEFAINEKFTLGINFEYHYAYFEATANWNLRSDFAHPESFTQEAEGYGLVSNIHGKYRLNKDLTLTLSVDYQDWQASRDGFDTIFFADGSSLKTERLNGVNWKSFGANLGLVYEF